MTTSPTLDPTMGTADQVRAAPRSWLTENWAPRSTADALVGRVVLISNPT